MLLNEIDLFNVRTTESDLYTPADKKLIYEDFLVIDHSVLKFDKLIGCGNFGEVYEGYLELQNKVISVAIKKFLKNRTASNNMSVLEEARLLNKCQHPNLIKLYGICLNETDDLELIILEYMNSGNMLDYLRSLRDDQQKDINFKDLLRLAYDISQGCEYLESINMIHRDIAARNCFLNSFLMENNKTKLQAKLGDFGLAKNIYTSDLYKAAGTKELPVRWMSPESLIDGEFSSKSDVWSFGIFLYEVFTLGQLPYQGMDNDSVIRYVFNKNIIQLPKYIPSEL